jgi:Rod binding domain-containing protein
MTDTSGVGNLSRHGPGGVLADLRNGRIQGEDARILAASNALEGTFFQELFKAMRDTVPESGLLDGGTGEDAFTAMLDQHLADIQAARTQGGIGQALYRYFTGGKGEGP